MGVSQGRKHVKALRLDLYSGTLVCVYRGIYIKG